MSTVGHVYQAITAVTAAMAREGISKGRNNAQQGYKFRGIDDVYNALSGYLATNNLCVLPRVVGREYVERATKSGGTLNYAILEVEFDLVSSVDGSKHTIRTVGEAMDSADKATNKAMSAAMKYACLMAFQIPTEGDSDADAHTPQPAPRNVRSAPAASGFGNEAIASKIQAYADLIAKAPDMPSLMKVHAEAMSSGLPDDARQFIQQKCSTRRREIEEGKAA